MIINTRAPRTLLFLRTTQPFHIPVIVIRPHDSHIIREFQSFIIYIKHLFIRSKCLWNLFCRFAYNIYQHLSLCHQCFLKHFFPLTHIIACIHRLVVQSTKGQSIYVLERSTFFHSRLQDLVHSFFIINVVPFSHFILFPLTGCIKQQRFTMGRAHYNGKAISNQAVFWNTMKRHRSIVHSRTEIICL